MNLKKINYEFIPLLFLLFSSSLPKIIIFLFLFTYLILSLKNHRFFTLYFLLVFFEPILEISIFGYSFSFFRIYQFFFIFKIPYILNTIQKNKFIFSQFKIESMLFLIFTITFINFSQSFSEFFSVFLNLIIVYLISIYLLIRNLANNIFYTIIFSTLVSGLYGLINDFSTIYSGTIIRYFSIIGDPNYSAFQYLFALFSIGIIKNKFLRLLLFFSLSFLVMSTISATAILIYFFIIFMYLFLYKFKFFIFTFLFSILLFYLFIDLRLSPDTMLGFIQQRFLLILSDSDISTITTGRSELFINYLNYFINNLSLDKILFGGTNIVYGDLSQELILQFFYVSHNTFLDMLFSFGVILFVIFITYFSIKVKESICENNLVGLSYLSLLIFMLSISIYPYRFFYILLFLKPSKKQTF
jgi:hypothetical protein